MSCGQIFVGLVEIVVFKPGGKLCKGYYCMTSDQFGIELSV